MRLVSSRTLLTAVAGLIAVPGAAIAAADPDTALLQVGSSNEEVDCEEYGDDLDGLDGLGGLDDSDDPDAEIPEECVSPIDDEGDGVGEGDEGDDSEDADDGANESDDSEDAAEGEDADEGGDADEGDDGEQEEVEEAPAVEDVGDEASERHGDIVSTVAHCAPRGQERVDGFDLPNLGAYVSTAARGEVLSVEAGEFDLSTLEGAEQLCDAIDQARADAAEQPAVDDAVDDGSDADAAASTNVEPTPAERGAAGNGKGKGNGAAQQDGGPGNSGNAPGRNR
jgi:hypothetical protein